VLTSTLVSSDKSRLCLFAAVEPICTEDNFFLDFAHTLINSTSEKGLRPVSKFAQHFLDLNSKTK
jgi:hypothetical protein